MDAVCRADGLSERREGISQEAGGEMGKAGWEWISGVVEGGVDRGQPTRSRGMMDLRRARRYVHLGWRACSRNRNRTRNHSHNRLFRH